MRARGFTMIELIVVIMIVGILAVVAVPRMLDRSHYDAFAFNDTAQSVVRFGQKTAVAQRRAVYVVISASSITLCFVDASCATPVPDPSKAGQSLTAPTPNGTTLSPATSFYFDGLGKPSFSSKLTVTMTSSVTRTFAVEAETGFVHP